MVIKYSKQLMGERFHSSEMDTDDFKKLIKDFIADTHPGDEIENLEINDKGLVDIKLKSGEEIEIEVDWNELILK
jgi:hypothetical protein